MSSRKKGPHGWCQQPAWFCQFPDNEIVEGNGYVSLV